jgi:hypothetical protein
MDALPPTRFASCYPMFMLLLRDVLLMKEAAMG